MLGLYSREELTKDEVTELIRREFLARLFEDNSSREDENGDNNVEEMAQGIILHLVKIRSILCPKAVAMTFKEAEALFYKTYCETFLKQAKGKEVPDGSGWWPDFLAQEDGVYTKGIVIHLAQLNVQYDIQWHKAMAEAFAAMQEYKASV
jgi:hypothetical protein